MAASMYQRSLCSAATKCQATGEGKCLVNWFVAFEKKNTQVNQKIIRKSSLNSSAANIKVKSAILTKTEKRIENGKRHLFQVGKTLIIIQWSSQLVRSPQNSPERGEFCQTFGAAGFSNSENALKTGIL